MKPPGAIRLHTIPMTFRQGASWVAAYHRHNKPPRGCKFVLGAAGDDGVIWGVAMAGRAEGYRRAGFRVLARHQRAHNIQHCRADAWRRA